MSKITSKSDGRQSDRAMQIRRGVGRMLHGRDFAMVPEVTLSSGRRADLVAIGPASEIWIIEIKSSLEDFRADTKWPDYLQFADRFFFATLAEVDPDIFPESEGLIIADPYGAEILREARIDKLAAAARKAMLQRVAVTAARRLHRLEDPNLESLL